MQLKAKINSNTCLSGTDHNQISLWILGSDYGQFNDLGILQCEKEEKLNDLSRKKCIYSWTNPMMMFVLDETRGVEHITNFTLE